MGLGMLLAGVWLVAVQLGVQIGSNAVMRLLHPIRLWPLMLVLGGLGLLVQYGFERRGRSGLLFLGTLLALTGLFLLLFTLQIGRLGWAHMSAYWPLFPLIFAAALLIMFLAENFREEAVLHTALLVGGVGLFALPVTLGVVGGLVLNQIVRLWPALLVLLLVGVFFQVRRSRESDQSSRDR
jgi:hypothetical protein